MYMMRSESLFWTGFIWICTGCM